MFKGALFLDAGNVWIADNKFNTWPSEAIFKMDKFYKDFYIGGGAGLRFDFDYFAIRLDLGFPIRVPYGDEDKKWVIKDARPFNNDWIRENLVFNIAVGYPF
jgi:outer membrane protein assembly factor BamA